MVHFKGIQLEEVNRIMQEEYVSNMADYYMAIHIRYFAIDVRLQHKGIGKKVFQGILADLLRVSMIYPIRLITIDALSEYHEWYKKIGFKDIPGRVSDGITIAMYLDCLTSEGAKKLSEFCNSFG